MSGVVQYSSAVGGRETSRNNILMGRLHVGDGVMARWRGQDVGCI
jgi:hypothetical protein